MSSITCRRDFARVKRLWSLTNTGVDNPATRIEEFRLDHEARTQFTWSSREGRYTTHCCLNEILVAWLVENRSLWPERYSVQTSADCDRRAGTNCSEPAP